MRLHLGCGDVHLEGWVNIDRRYQPGVDRVENIGLLHRFEVGSVDEAYSCHALDHFSRWEYPHVLKRWAALLKPGGILRISLPDFAWAAKRYRDGMLLRDLTGQLYAGQDYPDNVRHFAWDFPTAKYDLMNAGLTNIERFEPFANDASALTDEYGNLRSLNIQGRKP